MTDHDDPHCAGCILAIRHDLERPTRTEARARLREAIAGERRDWHKVEVSPDDLALALEDRP